MNLNTFFSEKNIPYQSWEIVGKDGNLNFIDNEVVIEAIKNTVGEERENIKQVLIEIDFLNRDVNHFLEHLAKDLVERY